MRLVAVVAAVMCFAGVAVGFPALTRAREADKRAAARAAFLKVGRSISVTLLADMSTFRAAASAAAESIERLSVDLARSGVRCADLEPPTWSSADEGGGMTLDELLGDGLPESSPLLGRLGRAAAAVDRALETGQQSWSVNPTDYYTPVAVALEMNQATWDTVKRRSAQYVPSLQSGTLGVFSGLPVRINHALPDGVIVPIDSHGSPIT